MLAQLAGLSSALMISQGAGLKIALSVSSAMTVLMAWPVVSSPTQMIFGSELVGRQHDAYTVMWQISDRVATGLYAQPATDRLGWLLTSVLPPVVAYNLLILATFPLAAATAYALSRYLFRSHAAALIAALAFAFAPIHLAHAAYHPHIAQVQWIPLYLLALFAAVDRPTGFRCGALLLAVGLLVLSNFYAGLIGAAITPAALLGYWWFSPRASRRLPNLIVPAAVLVSAVCAAAATAWLIAPRMFALARSLAFPASDVMLHSARWWAFLIPPADHALLGPAALSVMNQSSVGVGLLEQQVYLGYALMLLAACGIVGWRSEPFRRPVAAIAVLGAVAALVSVGPGEAGCSIAWWAPACRLHDVLPMFRSYARFAIVVQLAVALAAGVGAVTLWQRSRPTAVVATLLLMIAVCEYWPLPWRAHDVLPTRAHRWLSDQSSPVRALDCVPSDAMAATTVWLMQGRVAVEGSSIESCADPELGPKAAALGFTHLVVRADRASPPAVTRVSDFALAREFPDAKVYQVTAAVPAVVILRARGFHDAETAGTDHWQWMGPEGQWIVRQTAAVTQHVRLEVDLEPIGGPRHLRVRIGDADSRVVELKAGRHAYQLGPWTLSPGDHIVTFTSAEPAVQPSAKGTSTDSRLLTVAYRAPTWVVLPAADQRW